MSRGVAVMLMTFLGLLPGGSAAHEERLAVGRVERIEAARGLLVLVDAENGGRRRLTVDPETEVMVCRSGVSLATLRGGERVRVKYLDRRGGQPHAQFILVLGVSP